MAPRASLTIAGVRFALASGHRIALEPLDASYRPFVGAEGAPPQDLHVAVHVELGSAPRHAGLKTLLESDSSWRLASNGDCYYLTLVGGGSVPRGAETPRPQELWTARISRDVARVTVHCGERMAVRTDGGPAVTTPLAYPLDQVLLMHLLALHEGALVHAGGASIGGKGFIFAGKSGAGKSTLATCLAGRLAVGGASVPRGAETPRLLSDDRMALRKVGGRFLAYGTPWPGDQGAALNECAPLHAIFFIRHADTDAIVPIAPREAAERLLPLTSIPWYDPEPMTLVLRFLDDLAAHVPAFELRFRPGPGVVELLEREMNG
ncbi:MAG: hypothetical protein FJ291_06785 [Planctomycetes bacterium]|nr:hypothetical protein [Planctomycetota bacterium]